MRTFSMSMQLQALCHSVLRRASQWRIAALVLPLAVTAACGDMLSPGKKGSAGPATIAFTASVPRKVATATDVVSLNVVASYLRQDGSSVRIGSQVLTLTSESSQAVPIPVDVGTCLSDPARDVSASGNSTSASCAVVLNLSLLVNGSIVDEQVVGPLRLAPGLTTTVTQPVTLIDLASVEVLQGGSAVVQATDVVPVILGATTTLTSRVLDTRGQLVTDRSVVWSSDEPTVATVNGATGVITGVSLGTARISARIGTLIKVVSVRVQRPPVLLTINVGTGAGTGTVRSTPAGIDCKVAGAALSGTCAFSFTGESTVSLTSTADPGSAFGAWSDACASATNSTTCVVTMSQARVATARFAALRRLTVSAAAGTDGRGRVTGANGLDCRITPTATSGTCAVDTPEGAPYQLTAVGEPLPTGGTQQFFAGWGADCASATGATCTVTPGAAAVSASARFFDAQRITVTPAGVGSGLVTGGSTIACARAAGANTGTCTEAATFGTSITLTAIPDANSSFTAWSGACSGQSNTCTTTLSQTRNVVATFGRRQVALTLVLNGPGQGSATLPGGFVCTLSSQQTTTSCTQTFDAGSSVTVVPTAATSSQFASFGGACTGTGACTVSMNAPQTVSLTFSVTQYPLTVALTGTGSGGVTASDGGSCASTLAQTAVTCTRLVNAGTVVSFSTSPGAESTFGGFGGDCSGFNCNVTMNAPRTVSVTMTRRQVQLTLQLSGTGAGAVTVDGAPACSMTLTQGASSCTRLVDVGSTIVLGATPTTESLFDGFGGACIGGATCSLSVASPMTATASFRRRQVPLTMTLTGTGAGSISVDGSVACALALGQSTVTCTRLTDVGSSVVLQGAASVGSSFDAFSGDCGGTGRCTLAITAARTVGATFTQRQVPLTLSLSGQGGGSVLIDGAPFCALTVSRGSATCARLVTIGAPVVLTAVPGAESAFSGFTGACVGATSCTLTPTVAAAVSGTFDLLVPVEITVTAIRGTSGTVTLNGTTACAITAPNQSNKCTVMVPMGTALRIAALPGAETVFDRWGGDCAPAAVQTGAVCTPMANGPLAITVAFKEN